MNIKHKLQTHNSQMSRDVKAKSMILPPEGVELLCKFLIYHIAKLPRYANYVVIFFMLMLFNAVNVSAASYKIVYDDNVTSNMPEDVKDATMNDNVNISNSTPVRDGYIFNHWNTLASGAGTSYSVGSNLIIDRTTTNDYKLYAIWDKAYIQDFTLDRCKTLANDNNFTVYDKRDGNDYTVRYINGECWMTQNLRITGTISAEYSNFSGSDFNVSEYSLDSNDATYANHCDGTNGYNYACAKDSNSKTTGVWYNYYAASAGTIKTNSNTTPATSDICPSGWHLPSGPSTTVNTDYNKLVGNTTSGWQTATTGLSDFSAVSGGGYSNGLLYYTEYGFWWSATTVNDARRHDLLYNSGDGQFYGNGDGSRYSGHFLRCVRSS